MRCHVLRLTVLTLLALATCLTAQVQVCLSVHAGPANGVDNTGAPSILTATIAGVTTAIHPAPGQTAPACSAAHEAAFIAAGYATVRVNPNVFCITARPGGLPLTAGAAYGTTDQALNLDSSVQALPNANPRQKRNGALLGVPQVNMPPQPFGGMIIADIDILVFGSLVTMPVPIQLPPGQPGHQLQQFMQMQFEQHGLLGNLMTIDDPLIAGAMIDVLQLERTFVGEPVVGIEMHWDPNSRWLMPTVVGAGLEPIFGACEYGEPTQGTAFGEPFSLCFGQPQVGGQFDIVHECYYPNGITVNALSLGLGATPVFNGFLLTDPAASLLELGLTDPLGTYVRPWLVPPDPQLAGLQLASQAVVLDASGQHTFSTGMRVVIHP